MRAVYKRELKSYFHTVTGCLFIAVNLLFVGIYYTAFNLSYGIPYVSYALNNAVIIFLIITPILTMRSFSEERRLKTDQLLLTSPTSIFGIVFGKYLAMLTVFAVSTAIICVYPLLLMTFGTIPMSETYVAIFGYFLYGAACIAVGMFVSSLTENPILASIGTFAVLFASFLMSGIESLISPEGNLFTEILECFNIGSRLNYLMAGVFDLNAVLWFFTVIFLFLFFTYESIQKRRYSFSSKTLKLTAYSGTMTVFVTAIAVSANVAASFIPSASMQIDVTDDRIYSITEQTEKIIGGLTEDVTVYVFAKEENADTAVTQTLNKYEAADTGNHLKIEYIDPAVNPNFAISYGGDQASEKSLIVAGEKRSRVIDYNDLYETEFDYSTYQQNTTGYDAEGQLTSAISYVTSDDMPKMYVITGHNEASISDSLAKLFAKENIEIKEINLMNYDAVPSDASGILILSPTVDYSAEDVQKVQDYLKNGGKALIFSTYSEDALPNFSSVMEEYGCRLADGIVVESDHSHYYQNPFYLLPEIKSHDITSTIKNQNRYVFLPYAQGIFIDENLRDGLTVESLLESSEFSYTKADMEDAKTLEKEEEDAKGPFVLAVYVEEERSDDVKTQIAWFTTENMLTDSIDASVSGSNTELVMNAVSQMVDTQVRVSIPVKKYEASGLTIARSHVTSISFFTTIFLPLLFLTVGIIIWLRRKNR